MPKPARNHRQISFMQVVTLFYRYWSKNHWHKLVTVLAALLIVITASMYGIAQWYIHSQPDTPQVLGVSFVPDYATSLGVDPQANMDGLLDMGVRHFRLVSYWSDSEQTQGAYNFDQLDWQFKKAEAAGAKITLAIGLRQPRWPECHMPDWATNMPASQWQPLLQKNMAAVIERYKNSPSLESYQLENEYFNRAFGTCTNFDRDRLVSEYNQVKKLDPSHPIIISRSNNALGIPVYAPKPDMYGVSVYKRVWDAGVTHRYLEYPFPAWFYAFLAGAQKIHDGRDMIVHEMQAEAWAPNGKSLQDTSLDEQNKSLNAKRLKGRFEYGKATGMKQIYMWGSEYWYYRLTVLHDPSLWNTAKQEYQTDAH
jgi:hypothetical protein